MIRENDFVISDDNWMPQVGPVVIDGEQKGRGLIPRDYSAVPVGFYAAVPALTDIECPPRNDWPELIRQGEAEKSFLSHIRRASGPNGGPIPSLDQNGQGFCWSYSAHICVMLWRAKMGLPYKRLSAHGVACLIKNFRDEGGWAALSADYIAKNGCCDVEMWPEKSMRKPSDLENIKGRMLAYKVDGEWRDMAASVYDANLTEDQSYGLMFARIPHQEDYNWWSHSICIMDPTLNVRPTEAKSAKWKKLLKTDFNSLDLNDPKDAAVFADVFGKRGINSWSDDYGDMGEFVLTGSKARCDGGVAVGVPVAA
jgi:hypothetical protein